MNKVGRTLSAAATTVALAVAATGCASSVIGADGPMPGIAAQVEDTEVTLDELTQVTDGLCTIQAADDQALPTSRAFAQSQIVRAWVQALVSAAYAEEQGLDVTPQDARLEDAPGWEDVDEDDRDALQSYVDAFTYAQAVAAAAEGEAPDPADYDITINPRFDLELEGQEFGAAGAQLSVPVSEEAALSAEAPTAEDLEKLSDDEICGKRADPGVAPPAVPVG